MAIVNSLTYSMTKRDRMVTNRNALTYAANIAVLSLSLVLFLLIPNGTTCFTVLSLICIGGGMITTLFYTSQINEKYLVREASRLEQIYRTEQNIGKVSKINLSGDVSEPVVAKASMASKRSLDSSGRRKGAKQWNDWIKEPQFYVFAFVYMFARIALNVTATMMPLYLTTVAGFVQKPGKGIPYQIALVLLCSYTFSLLYSLYG